MSMRDFMGREPIKLEDIDLAPFRGQEQFLDEPGDERAARIDAADSFLEATALSGLGQLLTRDSSEVFGSLPVRSISEIIENPSQGK